MILYLMGFGCSYVMLFVLIEVGMFGVEFIGFGFYVFDDIISVFGVEYYFIKIEDYWDVKMYLFFEFVIYLIIDVIVCYNVMFSG